MAFTFEEKEMTTLLGILLFAVGLAIAGFIFSFAIWLIRNHEISFPTWIVLTSATAALASWLFAEESSMLIYQMTDVKGIPADVVGVRLLVLRIVTSLLDGTSKLLITLVTISEIIHLLDQTNKKPQGFWRKFKIKKNKNIKLGITAVITGALSTSMVGIYFYTL